MRFFQTFLLLVWFGSGIVHAQLNTTSAGADSLQKNNKDSLLSASHDKSYFAASAGISNSAFSNNVRALNTAESKSRAFFIPALGYYHKSGLSLYGAAYMDFSGNNKNPIQYLVTPGYQYLKNDNFSAGLSYTYYFGRDEAAAFSSPYQHEGYGWYNYTKYWLEMGFNLDVATGKTKESNEKDTIIRNVVHKIQSTATTSMTDFVFSPKVSHSFIWDGVLAKKDELDFSPTIFLNTGSGKYQVSYTGNAFAVHGKKTTHHAINGKNADNTSFGIESVAASLNFDYTIGKFTVTPEWYSDYYFHNTDTHWSNIFSLDVEFDF